MTRQRKRDIQRRRRRQRKVRYLRRRLERASDLEERDRLIAKIKQISPTAPIES